MIYLVSHRQCAPVTKTTGVSRDRGKYGNFRATEFRNVPVVFALWRKNVAKLCVGQRFGEVSIEIRFFHVAEMFTW